MGMKRSSHVGRTACEGRHVEAAAEADSCGVEAVRVTVNMCGLCRCEVCGIAVEAGVWRPVADVD